MKNMTRNMTLAFLSAMTVASPLAAPAFAEDPHAGHHMPATHEASSSAPDLYAPSRDAMHKGMDVKPTGNADKDFVLNMIPHHQGAVEMAKVQLEHGKDPELRKLAEDIIKAQDTEIAFMKAWLEKHK